MRDIKDHKTHALQLTPYKQLRKPVTPAEELKKSRKSLRSYFVGTGDEPA